MEHPNKIKVICSECGKRKPHYAKGLCLNCYKRLQYRNLSKKDKRRVHFVAGIYREKNREKYNESMRNIMRKKLNIKPKNYRV